MSLYHLKTSISELTNSNDKTSRTSFDEIAPTRNVQNSGFPGSVIRFKWENSGNRWWVPSRSYIRMKCQLTKANGTQLEVSDDVAPSMGLASHLFQSAEFRIAGKTVSRISDHMPQIDALEQRLSKSDAWFDTIGASTNFWQADFKERQQLVCSDGLYITPGTPVADTVTDRTGLGYDAPGVANNNSIEFSVAANEFKVVQGTNANALPTTSWVVGDYIRLAAPATLSGAEYKIVSITTQTNAETKFITETGPPANIASATSNFYRVRKNGNTGEATRRVGEFMVCWQPPLSIFKVSHGLPAGEYELQLSPETLSEYQQAAVESLNANKTAGTDFKFNVVDMHLICSIAEGPRSDDTEFLLDLEETRVQMTEHKTNSLSAQSFDVSPSVYALTVAFQDNDVASNTLYDAAKFKVRNDDEQKLTRYFIQYAGQSKPSPDANIEDAKSNPAAGVVGKDYSTDRYFETQAQTGGLFDAGGSESIQSWKDRGQYFYYNWPRDGSDKSVRVNVHSAFESTATAGVRRVLLFDHYRMTASVQVKDARVTSVRTEFV